MTISRNDPARILRLEKLVEGTKTDQHNTNVRSVQTEADVTAVQADVTTVQADVATLQSDVSALETDGSAPSSSPTPTVRPAIGALFATWTAVSNADPVTYEVHVSTSTGFTPDGTTLHGEIAGTIYVIRTLPDGTALDYATTYYVKTIAKDDDGSAAASTQGSGTPVRSFSADIDVTIGGGNQVTDSSFENASPGWSSYAFGTSTITRRASPTYPAFLGTYSLEADVSGSGPYNGMKFEWITQRSGLKYTASAWVYTDTASVSMNLYVEEPANPQTNTDIPTGTWTRCQVSWTAGSTGDVRLYIRTATSPATFYVDAVQVEEGDVATAYAPKTDEILPLTITSTEIADLAVIADKIAPSAVTAAKLDVDMGGGNMLKNSSFEDALTSWSGSAGTRTSSTTQFRVGAKSVRLERTAASGTGNVNTFQGAGGGADVPPYVKANQIYTFSGWFYPTVNRSIRIRVNWRNAAGTVQRSDTQTSVAVTANEWYRLIYTPAACPTNATKCDAIFEVLDVPEGEFHYVDAVQMEEGDYATAYAPKPDEILPSTITATEIADNAVTTPKLIANAVTAAKIAANTITANEIAANAITADELNANAVTADKINANAVTAVKIDAGAVTAAKIAAGAVTTEKLTVGSVSDNAILNGSFEEATEADATRAAQWTYDWGGAGGGTYSLNSTASDVKAGAKSLGINVNPATNTGEVASKSIPVSAGEKWYIGVWVKASVATTDGLYIRAYFGDTENFGRFDAEVESIDLFADGAVTTSFVYKDGQVTVPVNRKFMRVDFFNSQPNVASRFDFDDVTARKVTVSATIADGAIQTDKLAAGAVTALKIQAGTITANEIAAGTITAAQILANTITSNEIAANAITTDELAANSITAAKGQIADATISTLKVIDGAITNAKIGTMEVGKLTAGTMSAAVILGGSIKTATSGNRVEIDAAGVRLYAGAVLKVDLNASTGAGTFTGEIIGSSYWAPQKTSGVVRLTITPFTGDEMGILWLNDTTTTVTLANADAYLTCLVDLAGSTTGNIFTLSVQTPDHVDESHIRLESGNGSSAAILKVRLEQGSDVLALELDHTGAFNKDLSFLDTAAASSRITYSKFKVPTAQLTKQATQSITTTTETKVTWSNPNDTGTWDNDGLESGDDLVASRDGFWHGGVYINLSTVGAGTTNVTVKVRKNGAPIWLEDRAVSPGQEFISVPFYLELEVGDAVDVTVTCGAATGNSVIAAGSMFAMAFISDE